MARIIGIISGKGGVGKTTLVANLGVALSNFEKKVAIVDCNITTSHLGFYFDFLYYPKTLNQVLRDEITLEEATYHHNSGVRIIPAALSIEELMGVDINKLKNLDFGDTEIVLLDSAPGLGREAMGVLNACNELIFVATPFMNAISDVIRCNRVAKYLGLDSLGIVLNMYRKDLSELDENDVEELTELKVIAKIPFDLDVQKSLIYRMPTVVFNPYSPASIEIERLAAYLIGKEYKPPKGRFLLRILKFFKK